MKKKRQSIELLLAGLTLLFVSLVNPKGGLIMPAAYTSSPLTFSGYTWNAISTDRPVLPGPNAFSNNPKNVWVDSQGMLHLQIVYRDGVWTSSELVLQQPLGYGMYSFFVDGNFTELDSNIVVGMFLYKDADHEFDVELSRWGKTGNHALNYTVQPFEKPGNTRTFPAVLNGTYTTHQIVWTPTSVEFRSFHGHYLQDPGSNFLIADWKYTLNPHDDYAGLYVHVNLWLFGGKPSIAEGSIKDIVIGKFLFSPITG